MAGKILEKKPEIPVAWYLKQNGVLICLSVHTPSVQFCTLGVLLSKEIIGKQAKYNYVFYFCYFTQRKRNTLLALGLGCNLTHAKLVCVTSSHKVTKTQA